MSVILSSVFGTFARRRRQRRQPRAEFVHLAFSKQSATVRHVDLGRVHMATTTTSVCKEHAGTAERERDFFFFVRRIPRQFFSSFFHILFDGDNELLFCLLIVCVCQQKMGGTCVRPLLVLLYDFLLSRRRRR